jgi:hypothetical protein
VNCVNGKSKSFRDKLCADPCRAYIDLGMALHTLQDSWAGGHVVRDANGLIQWFQEPDESVVETRLEAETARNLTAFWVVGGQRNQKVYYQTNASMQRLPSRSPAATPSPSCSKNRGHIRYASHAQWVKSFLGRIPKRTPTRSEVLVHAYCLASA